jgi:predicted esterase
VPVDRVRATAEILRKAGAAVNLRISAPAPHEVHRDEVDALRRFILSVPPGRRRAR